VETLDAVERAVGGWADFLVEQQQWHRVVELDLALAEAPASVRAKVQNALSQARDAISKASENEQLEAEKQRLAQIESALQAEQAAEAAREAAFSESQQAAQTAVQDIAAQRAVATGPQVAQLERMLEESRRLEAEREAARETERLESLRRQEALEASRREAEASYRQELTKLFELMNSGNTEVMRDVASSNRTIVLGLIALAAVLLVMVIIFVLISVRNQRMQQEQFKSTLQTMQAMRTIQPEYGNLALPFAHQDIGNIGALPGSNQLLLDGRTTAGDTDSVAVKRLLEKCQSYGMEIDKVTGRRNASRLVADLVYKLSRQLGYSESDSILFFAVGLVYDIGFLNIDPTILRADQINEDQFAQIKTHANLGLNMVFFVDEQFRNLFKDGVSKHHENMDGSGYPYGLKGDSIPYIARALRVVESYVALISSREYRQIRDRDAALRELAEHSTNYDQKLVKALDAIV